MDLIAGETVGVVTSPYCVIKVREMEFKTAVKEKAGKVPKWNESFGIDVNYSGDDDITILVMDNDISKNNEIGKAKIKLSSFLLLGG